MFNVVSQRNLILSQAEAQAGVEPPPLYKRIKTLVGLSILTVGRKN